MATKKAAELMPQTFAFVQSIREAFGDAMVDDIMERAKKGEPDTFYAEENGYFFGTPRPEPSLVVEATLSPEWHAKKAAKNGR